MKERLTPGESGKPVELGSAMSNENARGTGYVGLPKNLLAKDRRGAHHVFALLPGLNRNRRRWLTSTLKTAKRRGGARSLPDNGDLLIEEYSSPTARRYWFWSEVGSEPPTVGQIVPSHYLAVDYWLLRQFEPNLERLSPLSDEEMREACPVWDEISAAMKVWTESNKTRFDPRYFALWPRVQTLLREWAEIDEQQREQIVNTTFALASIAGDTWFVQEALRQCPEIEPYLEGTVPVFAAQPDSKTPDADSDGAETASVTTGQTSTSDLVEASAADWAQLGRELRAVAEQLESGSRDAALAEALDALWMKYQALKQALPLSVPARDALQATVSRLERFLLESGQGPAAGVFDADDMVAAWRAVSEGATSEDECERVRRDAEQALVSGPEALARLFAARIALSAANADYARLREVERSATDRTERRTARRSLEEIETRLPALRDEEETAEEELIAAIEPARSAPSVVPRAPEETTSVTATDRPTTTQVQPEPVAAPPEPAEVLAEAVLDEPEQLPRTGVDQEDPVEVVRVDQPEQQCGERLQPAVEPAEVPASSADESVEDPRFTNETGSLCAPIWRALRSGEVALAYHAASAIRHIEPSTPLPSPALLSAVALGRRLQAPGGPIAEALRANFGEIDRNEFESGPEPWRLANSLLLLAACLRPLILAPDTGAAGVAEYVHLGAGMESLYEVQRLLTEYGQRLKGSRLDVAALGAVRSKAAWDAEFEQIQQEVMEWSERAPRFTVKFKAATDVWRRWISGDGVLARLIGRIQTMDASARSEVRELCDLLSQVPSFRILVDETDRRHLKRNRGEDIHAGAFEQLRQKAGEAVALAERWTSLIEVQPSPGDYLSRQLGELQAQLARVGQEAVNALASTVEDDAWGLVPAARRTLRTTLQELLDLFSGSRVPSLAEVRPERVLGEPLLITGRVPLNDDWRPESDATAMLDAIKTHQIQPMSVHEAFESYLATGDLRDARRLLELDLGPEDREEMERTFDRSLVRRREELRADGLRVEEDIALALAYSLIGDGERLELSLRVASLELGPATDLRFDLCGGVLEEIRSQIARRRAERAVDLTQRLEQLRTFHPEQDYSVIENAIREGDFPVATEYLHRLEQDPSAVLAPARVRDLFNDFFPDRCRQLQKLTEKLDAGGIRKVIQERLNANGVSFQHLTPERASAAANTWSHWTKLKNTRAPSAELLRSLLLALGFRDAAVTASGRPSGRIREFALVTTPVSDRDVCQAPQFGSRTEGRYRIACLWDPPSQEDYRQLGGDATTGPATIALYFGCLPEQKRRELSAAARGERRQSFLLLDEALLLFLCAEEEAPLAALFQCALPFTYTDPFVTTSSVVPPEMFFGRAEELASIKSMEGRCFVYGGRQLGKTALLRQAEREFHQPSEGRVAVWIDLKRLTRPDEIWVPIWRELRRHGILDDKVQEPRRTERTGRRIEDFVHALERWMADHPKQRVLLLLDEADRFLEFDARDGFPDTRRLKALMEVTERRFKVVFAGLHNVLRTTEQANQPLAHFGEAIEIGPLIRPDDLRAARELVLRPLMAAGFAFDNEQRADRVLALTNYYPSLIQLYCSKLLHEMLRGDRSNLDRRVGPRYAITARHLDSVYARQDLRDEIRSKFLLTLKLDPRYNLITYALAYEIQQGKFKLESGATVEEIRRIAESWWREGFARTAEPAFRVLLQEMMGLGVLREIQSGRFTLRNPNILLLLGSPTEVGEELLRERELPAEYEPRVWRMALSVDPAGRRRSPLTVSQIADVVARANGVVIVAGSEAAGIREVQEAVTAAAETGFVRVMESGGGGGPAAFHRTLDRLSDRRSGGTTVLFVGPDCPWSVDWVNDAVTRVERFKSEKNPVRVVFVADSMTLRTVLREGLPEVVPVVALEPWSDGFLREWLQEINRPSETAAREAILAQTGGWPGFVLEWCEGNSRPVDEDGEAQRKLARLGVDDPGALSALDDKPVAELTGGQDADNAVVPLRWAELLGLLRIGADAKAHVDPYVAELIMRA